MYKFKKDSQALISNARNGLKKYLQNHPALKLLIIGVSGGIDSALTLALASECGIDIYGYTLPIKTNHPNETSRAEGLSSLCTFFKKVDLGNAYDTLHPHIHDHKVSITMPEAIRDGNIKARMRMIYLYDKAHLYKGMVLSTDNLTELLCGYWSIHGDEGDFGMLQHCWKTEVYDMAHYILDHEARDWHPTAFQAFKDTINAVPTDGLGITNSDLDQLGVSTYAEVDKILQNVIMGKKYDPDNPVVKRHFGTAFKRANPVNLDRKTITKGVK